MEIYYIINDEHVISEQIDDDTVVINLLTGCYYNFNKSASTIFKLLKNGNTKKDMILWYKKFFSLNLEIATKDITTLLNYMIKKQLIINISKVDTLNSSKYIKYDYVNPIIEEFDDMQDMLLLDPIHEVKNEGWPYKKHEE